MVFIAQSHQGDLKNDNRYLHLLFFVSIFAELPTKARGTKKNIVTAKKVRGTSRNNKYIFLRMHKNYL